jgi:hypothetical protein
MKIRTAILCLVLAAASLSAQDANAPKQAPAAETRPQEFKQPFRFEYTLTELNGKQRINTRKFDILTNDQGEMHAGSQVPVPINGSTTNFEKLDTGLTVEMRCLPRADGEIHLHVEAAMKFLAASEGAASGPSSNPPVTRNINIRVDSQIKPGVPTVLGTVEDVASSHSYELSVTANPR